MGESKTAAERDVLRLLEGFLSTKVLITAYRLDVFTKLAREPAPLDAAPRALGLPARSGSILVNACLGLGLLELREGLVQTPARYHSLLVRAPDQPFNTTRYLLDYYHEVYRALSDMDELVRRDGEGSSFRLRDYFKADVSEVEAKFAADVQAAGLMHSPSDVVGDALAILRGRFSGPLMAYPDSGYFRMPHWQFEDIIEPDVLVDFAKTWVDDGVQILGGCCGLSPKHIAAMRNAFG